MNEKSPIIKLRQFRAHQTSIRCTTLGTNSVRLFATGGMNKSIKLWKTMNAEDSIKIFQSHYVPEKLSFDKEEELLLAGCGGGHLQLYDLHQGKMVKEHHGAHHTTITSVSFFPFDNYYTSAESKGATIKIWDIRKKNNLQTYNQQLSPVTLVKFSPDGKWLVSGEQNGSIKIWDIVAGKLLHQMNAHDAPVQTFEFHPSEFLLASVSTAGDIKMWDLETFHAVSSSPKSTSTGVPQVLTFNRAGDCLITGTTSHLNCYSYEPSIQQQYSTPASWRTIDEFVYHNGLEHTFTISRGLKEGYVSVYKINNAFFESEIRHVKKDALNDTLETEVVDRSSSPVVDDVPEEISLGKSTNDETKKLLHAIRSARFDMDKKHRDRSRSDDAHQDDDLDDLPSPSTSPTTSKKDSDIPFVVDSKPPLEQPKVNDENIVEEEEEEEEVVPNELIHERSPSKDLSPPPSSSSLVSPPISKLDQIRLAKKLEKKKKKKLLEQQDAKSSSDKNSSSLGSVSFDPSVLSPHVSFMSALVERQRTFDLLRSLWSSGHHDACLDHLSRHQGDLALSLDVIDHLLLSPHINFFNPSLFSKLIPIISRAFTCSISSSHSLLYQDFVERSLRQLLLVYNQLSPKIRNLLKHRHVTLQSAESYHIKRCHTHLIRCGKKANKLKKSSRIDDFSVDIIDKLQSL